MKFFSKPHIAIVILVVGIAAALLIWSRISGQSVNSLLSKDSQRANSGIGAGRANGVGADGVYLLAGASNTDPGLKRLKPIAALLATDIDGAAFLKALDGRNDISSADRQYYRAAVMTRCAQYKQGVLAANKGAGSPQAVPSVPTFISETRYEGGTGKILDRDPNAQMRTALKDRLAQRSINIFCKDIEALSVEQVDQLWQSAALLGGARAAAMVADRALRKELKPLPGAPAMQDGNFMMTLDKPSPDYLAKVTAGFAQADPSGVLTLGPLLQQSFLEGNFVFGPKKETMAIETGKALWELLACDVGAVTVPHWEVTS